MNNFGKQIAIIKPNRAKIIFESISRVVTLIMILYCVIVLAYYFEMLMLFLLVVGVPIVLAIIVGYIIRIILTACDAKTLEMYEHGIKINSFTCPYKKLRLEVSNSNFNKKLTFKHGSNSKVVRGYINPHDYNLILNKIKTYDQNKSTTETTSKNLKIIIKPNKILYVFDMIVGFILLNRYTIFNLEYDFVDYIIILSLYSVLCFLVFNRINKRKIYLHETYLQIDDFVAPYNQLTLRVTRVPFCRSLVFSSFDKTKTFDCYISKKDLDILNKKLEFGVFNNELDNNMKDLGQCVKTMNFSILKCFLKILLTLLGIVATCICMFMVLFLNIYIAFLEGGISEQYNIFLIIIQLIIVLFLFLFFIYLCLLFLFSIYDFIVMLIKNRKIELYERYLKIDNYIFKYNHLKISTCKSFFGKSITFNYKDEVITFENYLSENDYHTLMNLHEYLEKNPIKLLTKNIK